MTVKEVVLCIFLALLSLEDIRKKQIRLWPILLLFLWQLGFLIWENSGDWRNYLAGMTVGLVLCLASVLSKGVIGMGDGLVISLLGLCVGWKEVLAILALAFFAAGLVAMAYIALKKGKTARLPFIPYIYVGYVLLTYM